MDAIITCLTDNLEKLIEKKKEYDDALKSLDVERPDFFLFFFVFHFSFIHLFLRHQEKEKDIDEETRLNRELMKLEKEQERKKKELQAMAERKKEQHAKRASRHISTCFVIFFPACFFFPTVFLLLSFCV